MTTVPVEFDLDKLLDVALKGVRRASVFMGLGVNAASNKTFNEFQLSRITNIQLIPDDVPDETLRHFKEEFRIWIEAGGFRELSETFAGYLDSVHSVCLPMAEIKKPGTFAEIGQVDANFRLEGLPNKLNILKQRFGVCPQHSAHLVSLNRARNCLTHRQGIVSDEDIKSLPSLEVFWHGIDVYIEEPDGTTHNVNAVPEGGLFLENGGVVKIQFSDRTRSFGKGELLSLSTRDLAEICWFYEREARAVIVSVVDFAKSLGIEIKVQGE